MLWYSRWVSRCTHLLPQSHPQPDYIVLSLTYKLRRVYRQYPWSKQAMCFLGFCLFDVKGRKTHYDAKLTPWFARSLNVHLCGIWPSEFYDIIGLLVVIWNVLVTIFALASLPLIEATVHSFFYWVWRALLEPSRFNKVGDVISIVARKLLRTMKSFYITCSSQE